MVGELISLYLRDVDRGLIARRLREVAPSVQLDGPDDAWTQAVATFGRLWSRRTLTLSYDPAFSSEPNWSQQVDGMRGYFSQFPATSRTARVMGVIGTFRGVVATIFKPELKSLDDPRLAAVLAVAEATDAVIFTPGTLRDARGRVLYGAGGEPAEDPAAVWPRVAMQVPVTDPLGARMHERSRPTAPGEEGPADEAPSAERVAARALALTALTARAMLEREARQPAVDETYERLLEWARDAGADAEMEPEEREILRTPLGELHGQRHVDAAWRLEGLAVLAWALGRFELPPHDRVVDVGTLLTSMGVLDADAAAELLAEPPLRPREEIATLRNRLFALHWRLRDFSIRPRPMDFASFAATAWFGPLDLGGLTLVDGDLGVNGVRIDRASPDAVSTAMSIARERHQAANWLWEGPELYSEASEAT
ncbi:MAG TPA: DUF4272 domain-containing protein [Longimicrobium sp.]